MNKTFWIILGITIAALVGVFVLFQDDAAAPGETVANVENPTEITAEDHVVGNEDAAVTLIEYSDYQCPACASYEPILQQVLDEYQEDELRFVYRDFPLTSIHPNATSAARAAEAAGRQNAYWEMHDLLFERQDEWSSTSVGSAAAMFEGYAEELGLNMDQYREDLENVTNEVNIDIQTGQQLDVSSTPTFILEDEKIESNPRTFEEFKTLIDEQLQSSGQNQNQNQNQE